MPSLLLYFFFNDPATTEIYTLSLHDALPISASGWPASGRYAPAAAWSDSGGPWSARRSCSPSSRPCWPRSEEHTSELQSRENLVCRLLLEKKNKKVIRHNSQLDINLSCHNSV